MGQPIIPSNTLLNAEIGFLKTHLALIHIPNQAYHFFVQPLLSLLLHNKTLDVDGNVIQPSRPWHYWYPFVNVSITPNGCSVVCPRDQAETLFAPLAAELNPTARDDFSISSDDYSAITIGGEGLEAGQRVLDLTGPLALAGIPIFFITSYYSDFILVPVSARPRVIHALEEQGFVFQADDEDGESGQMTNPASPLAHSHSHPHFHPHSHHRHGSTSSSSSSTGFFDFPPLAVTPPPTTISELQAKTFKLLARHHITPHVDRAVELVTCAGIKDTHPAASAAHFSHGKLELGLARCLTASPAPRFLSVTLTDADSPSLTIETRLLPHFGGGGGGDENDTDEDDVLLGRGGELQVPITFDLCDLPRESAGIVAGVASRLTSGMKGSIASFNMSYLSTSRAGHVIVYEDELDEAIEALGGMANGAGGE